LLIRTKTLKKYLRAKLKKYKKIYNSSTVMYERMNKEILHRKKPTFFREILNFNKVIISKLFFEK
jgi:hypothetical protein